MSTTYGVNTGLGSPANGDRNWDAPLRANNALLDQMTALGSLATTLAEVPSASLNVKVSAGTFISSSLAYVTYAGGTIALTASITNYLWLTDAGVLTKGTAFPAPATKCVRLAVVVAGVSTITSVVDGRVPFFSAG